MRRDQAVKAKAIGERWILLVYVFYYINEVLSSSENDTTSEKILSISGLDREVQQKWKTDTVFQIIE